MSQTQKGKVNLGCHLKFRVGNLRWREYGCKGKLEVKSDFVHNRLMAYEVDNKELEKWRILYIFYNIC